MSSSPAYWNGVGRYQKAYDYFWEKWHSSHDGDNPWKQLLREISYVYRRRYNDGDSYSDVLDWNQADTLFWHDRSMPEKQRREVEHRLGNDDDLDDVVDYVLREIMVHHSTYDRVWCPETCRLVPRRTRSGHRALQALRGHG